MGNHSSQSVKHILVIEDEQPLRDLYVAVLQQSGFHVETAEDGEAGWNKLREAKGSANYDLVITDNNMPRLSGLELVQRMHSAGVRVPVIMASSALLTDAELVYVAALLRKPFTLDMLQNVVREVMSGSVQSAYARNRDFGLLRNPPFFG